mmetsp:Transcript_42919/g.82277  ORF Transcript_42919/g.82277 Transcript_42919/m.82277 type:complete len:84 (-) Transcript_42919:2318-2569(-)
MTIRIWDTFTSGMPLPLQTTPALAMELYVFNSGPRSRCLTFDVRNRLQPSSQQHLHTVLPFFSMSYRGMPTHAVITPGGVQRQ